MMQPAQGYGYHHGIGRLCFSAAVWLSVQAACVAQNIPLGTWRAHISFRSIHQVAIAGNTVFAATGNGIMALDREEGSIQTYSKLNGLSGAGITAIHYDAASQQLIVAYDDSRLDILKNNTVTTLNPLATTPITGSKRINHISAHNGLAYLATDYGVLVLDLARTAIKETWRDLGPAGETWRITGSTWKGDSIFLATGVGVMAGSLSDNLLDFANWKRFAAGDLNRTVKSVAAFNGSVYAAVDGFGVYRRAGAAWIKEDFLEGATFAFLRASQAHLLAGGDDTLVLVDMTGGVSTAENAFVTHPLDALEENGTLWIGDAQNGLVSGAGNVFSSYLPDGPATPTAFRLRHTGDKLQRLAGGFSANGEAWNAEGARDGFQEGRWMSLGAGLHDITDVAIDATSGDTLVASFGSGIAVRSANGTVSVLDNTNSPLALSGGAVKISALLGTADGVWVANYGAGSALHLYNGGQWQSFTPAIAAARYPMAMAVDYYNYLWVVANPTQGGGIFVFDKETGGYEYLTEARNSGGLPSRNVRSIALDRDGLVWVGTDAGVGYFFSPTEEITRPVFEDRYLLGSDRVTAIAVDGGNRKWMGTTRGVWLFNATGEQLIHNFTAANSPLFSDIIRDIAIDPSTGEVFFATDKGDISFRSDATVGGQTFQRIRIFPNPVTSAFAGDVGISGLAADAEVKITDASGKLIWQSRANGGTVAWNVRDYNGRRAASGIYVVFAATPDGGESAVGKIAVID